MTTPTDARPTWRGIAQLFAVRFVGGFLVLALTAALLALLW